MNTSHIITEIAGYKLKEPQEKWEPLEGVNSPKRNRDYYRARTLNAYKKINGRVYIDVGKIDWSISLTETVQNLACHLFFRIDRSYLRVSYISRDFYEWLKKRGVKTTKNSVSTFINNGMWRTTDRQLHPSERRLQFIEFVKDSTCGTATGSDIDDFIKRCLKLFLKEQ